MIRMMMIGNLGRDAEVRDAGGQKVISFTVAHNESYTDRQGVKQTRGLWVQCNYWREPGHTAVAQYLQAGTKVYVEGTPSVRTYTDKNQQVQASLELRVLNLELLGSKDGNPDGTRTQGQQQPKRQAATAGPATQPGPPEDDLPFGRMMIHPDQRAD